MSTSQDERLFRFNVPVAVGLSKVKPGFIMRLLREANGLLAITSQGEMPSNVYYKSANFVGDGILNFELTEHPLVAKQFVAKHQGFFFEPKYRILRDGGEFMEREISLNTLVGALNAALPNLIDQEDRKKWGVKIKQLQQLSNYALNLHLIEQDLKWTANLNVGNHEQKGIHDFNAEVRDVENRVLPLAVHLKLSYSPNYPQFERESAQRLSFLTPERMQAIKEVSDEYVHSLNTGENSAFALSLDIKNTRFVIIGSNYSTRGLENSPSVVELFSSIEKARTYLANATDIEWQTYSGEHKQRVTGLRQKLARTS